MLYSLVRADVKEQLLLHGNAQTEVYIFQGWDGAVPLQLTAAKRRRIILKTEAE